MNKRRSLVVVAILFMLISSYITLAYATNNEGSLASGYAVTSNYHGVDVPFGATVIVTAMTTDSRVDKVLFIWKNPAGQVMFTESKPVYTNGTTFNGKLVKYATSTFTPNSIGDWGVQAKFYDRRSFLWWDSWVKLATRATSFNVIPEIPLLGTVGAAGAMLAGLAVFRTKRKPQK